MLTINISEIISEFGTFLGKNEKDIKRLLLQKTISMNHMTTVKQDENYKASKAVIDDLVQGFQKAWTAKGNATFTPIEIVHRRHKVDLEFYPDEIVGSWLGFLADESKTRAEWPITKYIIYKLMLEKVAQNRELNLIGKGVYAATVPDTPQAVGLSMDGFCTIIESLFTAGTSNVNFITLDGGLTADNIFDQIEEFAGQIGEVYQDMAMNVHLSRAWFRKYLIKRRDLHGTDSNFDKFENVKLDGTNLTLVPLPSMASKDIIFCTPQENFIRLIKANDGASSINIEQAKRQVFVYADWHESVGFAIEEALFAYVPAAESASE